MPESRKQPNIVFILTDDQRFDAFGAAGSPVATPNMDALAKRGTWFTHAHVAGGTVGAVCMPSRAMIHSGRSLFRLHNSGRSIPAGHTLLGEVLKEAGYTTFGSGKWHNGPEAFARSFSDGDEIFFGGMADHWNVPAFHYDPSGAYDSKLPYITDPMKTNEIKYRHADHISNGRHSSDLIADAAEAFLQRHPPDGAPYFVYTAFLAPHDPRTMPQKYLKAYPPESIELPTNFAAGHPFDNGALHIRDEELAGFPRDPEEVKRHIAEYYAMIAHLDDSIGRIVSAVEARGEIDDTIFVFAGDNGLALGQHGLFGKQNLYDHSSRVPLIFAGPGVSPGAMRDDLVYLHDISATVLGLLGIEQPESMVDSRDLLSSPGTSLRPGQSKRADSPRDELYLAYESVQRGLRTKTHKLIEYAVKGRHRVQLFDLENDPFELIDLSDSEDHAELRSALARRLESAARESGDVESPWGKEFWSTARPDGEVNRL
ncbi:MAG: sulfatase-like hydrolase/transferase [Spirochaetaceae bacterium]